jgi:hypothetical protein
LTDVALNSSRRDEELMLLRSGGAREVTSITRP